MGEGGTREGKRGRRGGGGKEDTVSGGKDRWREAVSGGGREGGRADLSE